MSVNGIPVPTDHKVGGSSPSGRAELFGAGPGSSHVEAKPPSGRHLRYVCTDFSPSATFYDWRPTAGNQMGRSDGSNSPPSVVIGATRTRLTACRSSVASGSGNPFLSRTRALYVVLRMARTRLAQYGRAPYEVGASWCRRGGRHE